MAPQASRRFHEAGVGSRTGLRLSAVARDQDGFEDLEAFYKASEAVLDHRPPPDNDDDQDDEDEYDSFDDTRFSKRPASTNARRQDASSSSMMDIANSSAPSPRSVLRSARQSAASKGQASNVTLADNDDDLDLPDLSTGSRSFDLGVADDYRSARATSASSVPAKGFSERQASKSPVKGKGAATIRRVELSDSEDDRMLGGYDDDEDAGMVDDYDITPVRISPARAKPKSPARAAAQPAAKKRTAVQEERLAPSSRAAQSPKCKPASPRKSRPVAAEPIHELAYDKPYDEPDYHPAMDTYSPPPEPAEPPKRKRGRPPKNPDAPKPLSQARTNGVTRPASSKTKSAKASSSNPSDGKVVEKVRSQSRVATVFDENGVRRSTRQRFAPLEYWRGEHIRYGRPSLPSGMTVEDLRRSSQRPGEDEFEDDPSMMFMRKRVPVLDVKEVIRVPRAPGEGTFAGTTRANARTRRKRTKSEDRKSRTPDAEGAEEDWWQVDPTEDTVHAEEGWDARTVETGLVIDDDEGTEVEMSIVRTKASLNPVAVMNQEFRFEKLFNCGGLMATGVLQLPPGARKPTKPSKDNSFVFCVLQGALRATVHRKSFIVAPEGVFQVPAGNTYSLENVCERDVHLFFTQCRKTKKANAGDLTTFTQMSDTSYGTPGLASNRQLVAAARGAYRGKQILPREYVGQEYRVAGAAEGAAAAKTGQGRQLVAEDSDREDSEEDDFETSRQVKTKKRVFRKL